MQYVVRTVGDNDLPAGVHVVIVERECEPHMMLVSGLPARVWRLMRAWEDEHEACEEPSLLYAV